MTQNLYYSVPDLRICMSIPRFSHKALKMSRPDYS